MDIHPRDAPGVELNRNLTIPRRGLVETLRAWSGQGQLWAALAATNDEVAEREWTPDMIRRRANRVLFERLHHVIARWPADQRVWLEALPAAIETSVRHSAAPLPGTSWTSTRMQGWPPRRFVVRSRERVPETVLSTVTRWILEALLPVVHDAGAPSSASQRKAHDRALRALSLMRAVPLDGVTSAKPTSVDLRAIETEGYPWNLLPPVAAALLDAQRPAVIADLAITAVAPYPHLAWRLFQLAVLGEVLHGLRTAGARVVSNHPLGDSVPGPSHTVYDAENRKWDLWFEAAGAWKYYRYDEPYRQAAAGVPGAGAALGTDLMLARPGERALLIECKYSANPRVVAQGYLQTLAYAAEACDLAGGSVTAVVVGPDEVVSREHGWADTLAGPISIVAPGTVPLLIENALSPS